MRPAGRSRRPLPCPPATRRSRILRQRLAFASAVLVVALATGLPAAALAAPSPAMPATLAPSGALPGPVVAKASSFEDYRKRVDAAYDATVRGLGSGWRDVRATQDLAAELNTLLPGTERVAIDGVVVSTDNSILRSFVARLDDDSTSPVQRRETMRDVARHLGSLKLAVDEAARPVIDRPDALHRLLADADLAARPTLSDLLAKQIARLSEWLQDWFARVFRQRGAATAGDVVLGIVIVSLAAMLVTVGVYVTRALSASLARHDERFLAEQAGMPVVPASEGLPADAFAYAEELAAEGRFRDALRALFGGAARALVEFGLLRSTRTRTNAELLADLGSVAPPVLPPLSALSTRFERAWYGHAEPGADGYARARDYYSASMRAARDAARPSAEEDAS
jgi:hypothetical protein